MWIHGYKIQKNDTLPFYINQTIHQNVEQMANKLYRKYKIHLKKSVHSEACYLIINKGSEKFTVSFRNHGGRHISDIDIYLCDFKSWKDCEKYFVEKILPGIR